MFVVKEGLECFALPIELTHCSNEEIEHSRINRDTASFDGFEDSKELSRLVANQEGVHDDRSKS